MSVLFNHHHIIVFFQLSLIQSFITKSHVVADIKMKNILYADILLYLNVRYFVCGYFSLIFQNIFSDADFCVCRIFCPSDILSKDILSKDNLFADNNEKYTSSICFLSVFFTIKLLYTLFYFVLIEYAVIHCKYGQKQVCKF